MKRKMYEKYTLSDGRFGFNAKTVLFLSFCEINYLKMALKVKVLPKFGVKSYV